MIKISLIKQKGGEIMHSCNDFRERLFKKMIRKRFPLNLRFAVVRNWPEIAKLNPGLKVRFLPVPSSLHPAVKGALFDPRLSIGFHWLIEIYTPSKTKKHKMTNREIRIKCDESHTFCHEIGHIEPTLNSASKKLLKQLVRIVDNESHKKNLIIKNQNPCFHSSIYRKDLLPERENIFEELAAELYAARKLGYRTLRIKIQRKLKGKFRSKIINLQV